MGARSVVFRGTKVKTQSGLTKAALTVSSTGKIVSKKASAAGKKAYANIKGWNKAVATAKKALSLTGFVAVNGRTAQGKALYAKAKSIYNQYHRGQDGRHAVSVQTLFARGTLRRRVCH